MVRINKRVIWRIVKIFVKLSLFGVAWYVIVRRWPPTDIGAVLKEALRHWPWLLLALGFYFGNQMVLASRWWGSARAYSQRLQLPYLMRAQIKLSFLEIVTPIPDAEDMYKVLFMRRKGIPLTSSLAVVAYDRFFAVLFILLLIPGTIHTFMSIIGKSNIVYVYSFMGLFLLAFFFRFQIVGIFIRLIGRFFHILEEDKEKIMNLLEHNVPPRWKVYSLVANVLKAVTAVLTILTLAYIWEIQLPALHILWALPLFSFSVFIPVSYQGLGLFEATIVLVLIFLGVEESIAASIGILHFFFNVVVIACGGLIFLFYKES